MNEFLQRAMELESQMQKDRHYLHQHAEAGEHLPGTTAYVMERLASIGLSPQEICDSGITALIEGGHPGKTILLRADMDALPMNETNSLPFKTVTGAAHNCGHDIHTSMLLAAARILYERRDELRGNVKLMFQPAEEVFSGSENMIKAGLLSNPTVDAAMGIHVMLDTPVPSLNYGTGFMTSSCDGFKITVKGVGCHGAMPHLGIDPINVGFHIYSAFQNLIARECDPGEKASLTLGAFNAGSTSNIIPDSAVLMGTLRTYNKELRARLVKRMHEITEYTGRVFGVTVLYESLSEVPSTYSDPDLTRELAGYASEITPDFIQRTDYSVTPSDDFARVAEKVPSVYFMIGCKVEGCTVQHHNPGVLFDETVMPYGAAVHAACAYNWLNRRNA
ncbi:MULTISPECIES: M20 family metallopeptidase [unclassified Clostridium]|mgnify:FL=1|uniref:M20 metallopeptidase family protein n=1 Tax=unclassified Clostridium TaxID=2614128 RepID=UPI001106607A|nr:MULTISPECIES: M20 family metallopeptidase [unclassified Clostridium]